MEEKHSFILLLSDTHIGRVTKSYDIFVFQKRMDTLRKELIKAKKQINRSFPLPDCHIFFLGDIIDNEANWKEHPFEVSLSVEEQIEIAKNEFAYFITGLRPYFKTVHVHAVMGNHGRVQGRARAPTTNWDYVLYKWLRDILEAEDVRFEIQDEWYGMANIGKFQVLYTHGDCVYSYHGIPVYGLVRRALMWKAGEIGENFSNVFIGHWHVPSYIVMNKLGLYINGTFLTDDPYSLKKGYAPDPAQWVIVTNREGKVAWHKLIYI